MAVCEMVRTLPSIVISKCFSSFLCGVFPHQGELRPIRAEANKTPETSGKAEEMGEADQPKTVCPLSGFAGSLEPRKKVSHIVILDFPK